MRCLRLISILFLFGALTSFIENSPSIDNLPIGEPAPNFHFRDSSGKESSLYGLRGKYILLNFWASYDAFSRIQNITLNSEIQALNGRIELISVSFDKYQSIFNQTVKTDRIKTAVCFVDTSGIKSDLYKDYQLNKGFKNYLLDKDGIIIACNINASDISLYIDKS